MSARRLVGVGLVLASTSLIVAQTPPPAAAPKSLAATMQVYVFPNDGQTPEQQSKDEGECYSWAVQNTGTDPFALAKQAEEQKQKVEQGKQQTKEATKGAGAKGAVGGAAAGALIGEIASDDAGKGAAYGAAAGAVHGRRKAAKATAKADEKAKEQTQQVDASLKEQTDNFKKAFSVCLESKKYMVKF